MAVAAITASRTEATTYNVQQNPSVAQTLISLGWSFLMSRGCAFQCFGRPANIGRHPLSAFEPDTGDDEHDGEPDEAPETPLDEPRPPRVEDPPSQPEPKGPYVVHAHI